MKHKLAFIGPKIIHDAFKDMNENWDMQAPLTSLEEYNEELSLPDEITPKVARNTNVVIFFSRLFQSNPDLFADLVAFTAPFSVVCILTPTSELARDERKITSAIKNMQITEQQRDSQYNTNTPFYFVKYEDAEVDIYNAIREYCRSPFIEQEVKDDIKKILDDENNIIIEDEL